MKKNYVIDTNVLLHDPEAIFKFQDNDVILPIQVIEEIDHFKREMNDLGYSARQVVRHLDEFRKVGSLSQGVPLPSGGRLRIDLSVTTLPAELSMIRGNPDNYILALGLELQKRAPDVPMVLVSKDVNMRVKADAMGLRAENYENDRVPSADVYSGSFELEVTDEDFDLFREQGDLPFEADGHLPNECVMLRQGDGVRQTLLGRLSPDRSRIRRLYDTKRNFWGLRAKNREQCYALDLLLDPELSLVTIAGKAGTGKTLLAAAAGLHMVTEEKLFQRLLISRPIYPMGRDIGYLPGAVETKLAPWMQPIYDSIGLLIEMRYGKRSKRKTEDLASSGRLAIEPLTYIRGRSIPNQILLVDEAQNLTPIEAKTVLTRAGDNTKVVFTGDLSQIDNPYVDSQSNGLSTVVDRFKGQPLAGHVTLTKGERSPLAELAANVL